MYQSQCLQAETPARTACVRTAIRPTPDLNEPTVTAPPASPVRVEGGRATAKGAKHPSAAGTTDIGLPNTSVRWPERPYAYAGRLRLRAPMSSAGPSTTIDLLSAALRRSSVVIAERENMR